MQGDPLPPFRVRGAADILSAAEADKLYGSSKIPTPDDRMPAAGVPLVEPDTTTVTLSTMSEEDRSRRNAELIQDLERQKKRRGIVRIIPPKKPRSEDQ